jgi:hypothetical protein
MEREWMEGAKKESWKMKVKMSGGKRTRVVVYNHAEGVYVYVYVHV